MDPIIVGTIRIHRGRRVPEDIYISQDEDMILLAPDVAEQFLAALDVLISENAPDAETNDA